MDELRSGPTGDALPLSLATLPALPASIGRPSYMRAALSAGIVHIGVGNFHRAHMASYLDELFGMGLASDWAIIGAGVTEHDAAMRARLAGQDWLSTVVERDTGVETARVIGSMIDFIAPDNRQRLIEAMAAPSTRIVSLTITEGGYFLDAGGHFDAGYPVIRRDAQNPSEPTTAFGLIIAALARRRAAGIVPFTVLCCDNVPHNGDVTRGVVAGLARLSDPDLAGWIEARVAFPNAMVDRIAPAVNDTVRAYVATRFGIRDAAPVPCEPFRQWVIEDHFSAGRPPLEKVGVTFVDDVTPFELMKLRMLNGGHAAIAYPAGLLGITFVHEAMQHPLIAAWLDALERREIIPRVPPVPNTRLDDYLTLITGRFANPTIGDTIRRLCLDGSGRQPKFIIPTIRDALAANGPIEGLALESALWCRYCVGRTETGAAIEPNDPIWPRLTAMAAAAQDDPAAWLAMDDIYGDTGRHPRFQKAFAEALTAIRDKGVEAVLKAYAMA